MKVVSRTVSTLAVMLSLRDIDLVASGELYLSLLITQDLERNAITRRKRVPRARTWLVLSLRGFTLLLIAHMQRT